MTPIFFGLAGIGGAVALSRKVHSLSGPTGDKLCNAWSDLADLLVEWTEHGIRLEVPNPASPMLPRVTLMRVAGDSEQERCEKAQRYFHTLFRKTERLEKAAGAEYSGDILNRKLMASRIRSSSGCKGVTLDDLETLLEEAHEIQRTLLRAGTEHGCYGRPT